MRRTLLLFGSVIAILIGIGLVIFFWFVREEPGSTVSVVAPPDAGLSAADPGPAPEPADAGGPPPAPSITVLDVRGQVSYQHPEQPWQPAEPGTRLAADDVIRTGPGASARLQVDEHSIINLEDRGELAVRLISETVHRFSLKHGKIKVDYSPAGERVLRIESEETGAVAETRAGRFTAMSTRGTFAVATTTGEVKLSAKQGSVAVAAGQMSMVAKDRAPARPGPISTSILLKVALPAGRVQREPFIELSGQTSPGALVQVNDVPARVDARGRFRVRVELREGKNPLKVRTEDVAGNVKQRDLGPIIVDPSAPIDRLDIQWGKDG